MGKGYCTNVAVVLRARKSPEAEASGLLVGAAVSVWL